MIYNLRDSFSIPQAQIVFVDNIYREHTSGETIYLEGIISSVSTITGNTVINKILQGDLSILSTLSGNTIIQKILQGDLSILSTLSGNTVINKRLAGNI